MYSILRIFALLYRRRFPKIFIWHRTYQSALPIGGCLSKAARIRRRKERRKTGLSREEYEGQSASETKPWEGLGISRASYYRKIENELTLMWDKYGSTSTK